MTARLPAALAALVLLLLPLALQDYFLHIAVQVLLWGFIYTAWSLMGRFGLVSLGHGAFLGIGGYVPALLWNYYDVTPWLGIPASALLAALLALVVGYPATRMRVIGHYYALVTLALSQVVLLSIVALRDVTGGSLGMTPRAVGHASWYALQFPDKSQFYFLALVLWLAGLALWRSARPRHGQQGARGDQRGRGRGRRHRHRRHAREAARDADLRRPHRSGRRASTCSTSCM